MTPEQLLAQLRALDVQLRADGGRLRVNAPAKALTPALEAALRANKEALLQLVTAASDTGVESLVPVARSDALRLSFLQERLWVLHQLQPDDTAYNLAVTAPELHDVDVDRFVAALRRVVSRHEIFHSRFVLRNGVPVVELASPEATTIQVRDLRRLTPEDRAEVLGSAASAAVMLPFDLAREAPIRFTVLRTGDSDLALLTCAHHIAMDAWSMGTLRREIALAYDAPDAPAAAPLIQYVDYAQWLRRVVAGDRVQAQLRGWVDHLRGLPELSTFPTDYPRSAQASGDGASYGFWWSAALYDDVRRLARELDATVYMVLVAALAVVLSRRSGQTDLAIGSPIGTRERAELEGMIGPVVNPIVLRVPLDDDPAFTDVVHRVRAAILDGHENLEVPFEALVQAINPVRALGHAPLFQVAVVLHNAPDAEAVQIVGGGAIYDLTIFAVERDGAMSGSLEYRRDLYDEATIGHINAQIIAVLEHAVQDRTCTVSRTPLLTPESQALTAPLAMPAPVPVDPRPVGSQFATMAIAVPERTAVVAHDVTLTYADLAARSARVAAALGQRGVGRGDRVGIAIDREADMLVAVLGVLRAGAAFVPVDPMHPTDRLAWVLADSGMSLLVVNEASDAVLSAHALGVPVFRLDADAASTPTGGDDVLPVPLAGDVAYVMYTSGSTGRPKGVSVTHGNLSNFLQAMRDRPGISGDDVVLGLTPMTFDISLLELLLPLTVGARVVIASRDDATDGATLAALLTRHEVTLMQATPSTWQLLRTAGWVGRATLTAITGGEALPADLADWLLPRVRVLWNAYGPTETTIWSTIAQVMPGAPIVLGTPIANTRIHLLDGARQPVPIGVPGEICIGGAGVAAGYLGQPQLTAASFVPEPDLPEAIMYRTGDIGRWRNDGTLEYLGRLDGQVKLRGYRIETGEVEMVLTAHPAIGAAVVAVRAVTPDDQRLVAWVTIRHGQDATVSEIRRHARTRLPDYMVPGMIVILDRLPLTPNGKVDQRALPDPFLQAPRPQIVEPLVTETERLVADIWRQLLGVAPGSRTDMFFDLGGYSLLAMRAAQEIGEQTRTTVDPRTLFFRTLGEIAAACDVARAAGHRSGVR